MKKSSTNNRVKLLKNEVGILHYQVSSEKLTILYVLGRKKKSLSVCISTNSFCNVLIQSGSILSSSTAARYFVEDRKSINSPVQVFEYTPKSYFLEVAKNGYCLGEDRVMEVLLHHLKEKNENITPNQDKVDKMKASGLFVAKPVNIKSLKEAV